MVRLMVRVVKVMVRLRVVMVMLWLWSGDVVDWSVVVVQ